MPTAGSELFAAASSQRLQVADGTKMVSAAGQAFMWGGWFNFTSLAGLQYLMVKGNLAAASLGEYGSYFFNAVPGTLAVVSNGTTQSLSGYDNTPALTTGTWHFIICWYDPSSSGTINISIDNGTPLSAAATTGTAPNTSLLFTLGSTDSGTSPLDAAVDSVFAIQRATAFTAGERTWLYNQGYGRIAIDLGVAGTFGENLIPTVGKGDWWDLNDNNTNHVGAFNGIVLASIDSGGSHTPTHQNTGIPRYTGSPPPPTYAFDKSFAYFSGFWNSVSAFGHCSITGNGLDSTCEFIATGTDCTVDVIVTNGGGGEAKCSVEGVNSGAWFPLVPSSYGAYGATCPVFSGLSDAPRNVKIRAEIVPYFAFAPGNGVGADLTAGFINVTGANPSCSPPTGFSSATNYVIGITSAVDDQTPVLNHVRLESMFTSGANDAAAGYNPIVKLAGVTLGSDGSSANSSSGGQIRFKATTPQIDIWIKNDGQAYALAVDGVYPFYRIVTPITNVWSWVTIGSGLDGSSEHTYGVIQAFQPNSDINAGAGEVWAVRTPGGTMNTASQPALRSTINFFGDSITGNQDALQAAEDGYADTADSTQGWVERTAEKLGCQFYCNGIGSTTLHDFTGNTGTLGSGGIPYVTTWSGEQRATHDVVNAPTVPIKVVVEYGRNDVGQAWFPQGNTIETVSIFSTAFTNTINTINAGLPSADVYVMGILPAGAVLYNGGYGETDRVAFNNAMQTALTSIGNAKNRWMPVDLWGFGGPPGDASGTDFSLTTLDLVHPNRNGRDIVFNGTINKISGTAAIACVPVICYPSQVINLRLTGFGTTWTTSHNITASAGTFGTQTIYLNGYAVIPYTAPATPQAVTVTDVGSGAVGTLHVVVPTLTISPVVADPNTSVTLAFSAPFTSWAAASQSTTFTSPGIDLTGTTVTGLGRASDTFTTPNIPGKLIVITDTTTGQTATLTLTGSPTGSPILSLFEDFASDTEDIMRIGSLGAFWRIVVGNLSTAPIPANRVTIKARPFTYPAGAEVYGSEINVVASGDGSPVSANGIPAGGYGVSAAVDNTSAGNLGASVFISIDLRNILPIEPDGPIPIYLQIAPDSTSFPDNGKGELIKTITANGTSRIYNDTVKV